MKRDALAEPRRVVVCSAVVGLIAGGRSGAAVVLALALSFVVVVRHLVGVDGATALIAALVLLVGAVWGQARTSALERTELGPLIGTEVTGEAIVLDAFRPNRSGSGASALARFRGEPVLLRVPAKPRAALIGSILSVKGGLRPPDRSATARGAHATLMANEARATGLSRGGVLGFVDGVRRRAMDALRQGLPPPDGALLTGMVLGQDADLPPSLQDDMRATSLSHLTAASGQNVALLAALATGLGIALGLGVRARWLMALALIVLYVPLAGGGPSIVRAGIMGSAAIVAAMAGRPASRADALLVAALLTLAIDPRDAADLGWQLSFAAVIGIALLAQPVGRGLGRARVPRVAAQVCAVTLSATVATAPILALRLGRISPLAVPANVMAAPAVPLVMTLGSAAAALGQISAGAARPFAAAAAVPTAYVAAVGRRFAQIRAPSVLGSPGPPPVADQTLRVTALDIGQGDATLIETPDATVLVDTGPPGLSLRRKLRAARVARLDALVLTHPQLDHIGDAPRLLAETPIGLVLDGRGDDRTPLSRSIDGPLRTYRPRVVAAFAGQRLAIGSLRLDVLWPPTGGGSSGGDPNDRAIVLVASAFGRRALMTADAESNVLLPLRLPAVDLLKVSHHGSEDPGLPAVLDQVRPRVAVIEVGEHNDYGHPTAGTLAALQRARVPLFRTDRDGAVRFDLAASGVSVTRRAGP